MAKKRAKSMWVARDEEHACGSYNIFRTKPRKGRYDGGMWGAPSPGAGLDIRACQSPVELEPGGGPVRVRLVVDKA